MLRNDHGHYRYDRVLVSEAHQLSNARAIVTSTVQDRAVVLGDTHMPQQADVVLKCLHRDDPLRHSYLRRRWRAT
jgi:hypothetical protein